MQCYSCGKTFSGSGLTATIDGETRIYCADCYWKVRKEYDKKKTCDGCTYFSGDACEKTGNVLKPISIGINDYFIQAEKCCAYSTKENSQTELGLSHKEVVSEFEEPFRDADEHGKRIVTINDSVLSADGIGKHLKIHTEAAGKYGYSLINMTQTPSQFCIFMAMVFEKKEITQTKFVNCSYCKSRYDANQYFKCPNCGGILVT
jgi:hypothetical protein